MSYSCWKCGVAFDLIDRRVSFRAYCDSCGAALHCCRNCKYYSPGRANSCAIPGTEPISDREANNFCDHYIVLTPSSSPSIQKESTSFDDLFK